MTYDIRTRGSTCSRRTCDRADSRVQRGQGGSRRRGLLVTRQRVDGAGHGVVGLLPDDVCRRKG
jgi:hypothetical protein